MAETKEKKGFNVKAYSGLAFVVVAAILVALTIFAFTTRYTAFKAEKVAQAYVDCIVQSGDGYNAYKNTLVSKNMKYGDFIRQAYMAPYVNEEAEQADFVGEGTDEEAKAIDAVYTAMYDYLLELIDTYGLDDYDNVFNSYFSKLAEVRHQVYGDDFMNTDYMFGAFEANMATYGESLTGTEEQLAADEKTVVKEKSIGKYQEMFGEDYKLTTAVKSCVELSADEIKAYVAEYEARIKPVCESGENKADSFNLTDSEDGKSKPKSNMISAFEKLDNSENITSVAKATVEVTAEGGNVVAVQELYVVQIGNSWYVDDTNVDTSALYLAK